MFDADAKRCDSSPRSQDAWDQRQQYQVRCRSAPAPCPRCCRHRLAGPRGGCQRTCVFSFPTEHVCSRFPLNTCVLVSSAGALQDSGQHRLPEARRVDPQDVRRGRQGCGARRGRPGGALGQLRDSPPAHVPPPPSRPTYGCPYRTNSRGGGAGSAGCFSTWRSRSARSSSSASSCGCRHPPPSYSSSYASPTGAPPRSA